MRWAQAVTVDLGITSLSLDVDTTSQTGVCRHALTLLFSPALNTHWYHIIPSLLVIRTSLLSKATSILSAMRWTALTIGHCLALMLVVIPAINAHGTIRQTMRANEIE